jgi:hypothetical protein
MQRKNEVEIKRFDESIIISFTVDIYHFLFI